VRSGPPTAEHLEKEQPHHTRADLFVAIFLAALIAAWLIVYGAILIKYGVPHGH
jgi:hypothetical protein